MSPPAAPSLPPGQAALESALDRLARSRQSLREALVPGARREAAGADAGAGAVHLLSRRLRAWLRAGPLAPVTRALNPWLLTTQRVLGRWWRRHPWRTSVVLAGDALERTLVPWARRHPILAVGLGAAAGAALALAAPWRWASSRQFAANSGRRARRWLLHQISSPAAQTVLAGIVASVLSSAQAASERKRAPDDAQDAQEGDSDLGPVPAAPVPEPAQDGAGRGMS